MGKEVELILSKLKIVSENQERGLYLCDKEHSKLLLDYITNLQEENDRLSVELNQNMIERNNYLSRNEKVINNLENSIKSINIKLENNKEPFEVIDGKIQYLNDYQVCRLKAIRMKCKELLSILQGEDKYE